jgi:hypothetical protein
VVVAQESVPPSYLEKEGRGTWLRTEKLVVPPGYLEKARVPPGYLEEAGVPPGYLEKVGLDTRLPEGG